MQLIGRKLSNKTKNPLRLSWWLSVSGVFRFVLVALSLAITLQFQSPSRSETIPTASSTQMTAEDFFNRAIEKYHPQRDYQGAIADFTQAIQLKPDHDRAYLFRGLARMGLKDWQNAIADLTQSIQLRPDHYYLRYDLRGYAYSQIGKQREAAADFMQARKVEIAAFTRSIQLDPNDYAAYRFRGHAYLKLGEYQQAIADLTQTIKLQPNDAYAYELRGTAHAALNNRKGAIADLRKAADFYQERGLAQESQELLNRIKELRE
jgi:tetratricopeptide (TPR) repeat protein